MKTMLALLRFLLKGTDIPESVRAGFTEEEAKALYQLANRYDLAHLVGAAAIESGLPLPPEIKEKFLRKQQIAFARSVTLEYELESAGALLSKAEIPYIPLKGAVVCREYPERWMRTSSDLDILIHPEDMKRASELLKQEGGFVREGETGHDVSFCTPGKVHFELHFDLIEEGHANSAGEVLRDVWSSAQRKEGFRYELDDPMFYFYHIAHMAKHTQDGGCGVRPFLDLWILNRRENADTEGRRLLLERGGLARFAEVAEHLSAVWMEEAEPDEDTSSLESFLENGGTYGSLKNRVAVFAVKRESRLMHIWKRIFLPLPELKAENPILRKHPWLAPAIQVRRWLRLIFGKRLKRSFREISISANLTDEELKKVEDCLSRIGLQ